MASEQFVRLRTVLRVPVQGGDLELSRPLVDAIWPLVWGDGLWLPGTGRVFRVDPQRATTVLFAPWGAIGVLGWRMFRRTIKRNFLVAIEPFVRCVLVWPGGGCNYQV